MEQTRKIFTLTELGKSLRSVIERNYTSSYWIKAEIAKLNHYPRSGHCYPELVDKSGNMVKAQMRATIWATDYTRINREFLNIAGQKLSEGMSILFRGSVSFHPVHGLSLQILEIEPAFTLGEMALEKTKNLELLKKEGVLHKNKSLPMPLLVKNIAVISVETSKGYGDFLSILKKQAKEFGWWHFLFPSVLQGDKAAEGIISQLRIIRKVKQRFDMVAIIRGGGGDIGLNCYDDYQLSREIALFPLPVMTGIGHSTNETIAEMVAWENKITPTDVAYFIVERFNQFEQRIDNASRAIQSKTSGILKLSRQMMNHLNDRFRKSTDFYLKTRFEWLNSLRRELTGNSANMLKNENLRLDQHSIQLSLAVPGIIRRRGGEMDNLQFRLNCATSNKMMQYASSLYHLETKIKLLDPGNILKRGYSITFHEGRSVKDASELKPGDEITTRLYKGILKSKVAGNGGDAK